MIIRNIRLVAVNNDTRKAQKLLDSFRQQWQEAFPEGRIEAESPQVFKIPFTRNLDQKQQG